MAKGLNIQSFGSGRERGKGLYNGDERLGFLQKLIDRENPARSIYGIGIDNMGSPYRGIKDEEIKTPLGTIGYGYDGDTVAATFNPALYGGTYKGDDSASFWAGLGDKQIRGSYFGSDITGGSPIFGIGLHGGGEFPEGFEGYYDEINTPLGKIGYGTSDSYPSFGASYEPNYYINALVNLLRGNR